MKYYLYISTVLLALLAFSCQKQTAMAVVDDEMKVHYEAFEYEAASRGKAIDLEKLQVNGHIAQIDIEDVIGQSIKEGSNITIKVDPVYWEKANYMERELLIFHELGHAILEREHQDATIRFNQCTSIMRSSSSVCKCNYNSSTRVQYLNELFN